MSVLLTQGNAVNIPLADRSVHCVVTSPPYWGLRDYGIGDQLGLEPTPEQYVENMVAVFREVRRVLRDDGTVWLNLGDSYNGTGAATPGCFEGHKQGTSAGTFDQKAKNVTNLKPKDLCGIPWRVAFALQADGWWLRSDIIWSKPNPMPESVTDRPTKAHEYLFLLTKSARYYYDADAVREPHAEASLPRALRGLSAENKWVNGAPGSTAHTMSQPRKNRRKEWEAEHGGGGSGFSGHSGYYDDNGRLLVNPAGRNRRTVWEIATRPYSGAHFATYPPALVEPCIKAGTSERGVCPECGSPWERVVEKKSTEPTSAPTSHRHNRLQHAINSGITSARNDPVNGNSRPPRNAGTSVTTLGWRPTCEHYQYTERWREFPAQGEMTDDEYYWSTLNIRLERRALVAFWRKFDSVPATIFDPFAGSGTTLQVARALGRNGVGLDLSAEYLHLARERLSLDALDAWAEGGKKDGKAVTDLPLFGGEL